MHSRAGFMTVSVYRYSVTLLCRFDRRIFTNWATKRDRYKRLVCALLCLTIARLLVPMFVLLRFKHFLCFLLRTRILSDTRCLWDGGKKRKSIVQVTPFPFSKEFAVSSQSFRFKASRFKCTSAPICAPLKVWIAVQRKVKRLRVLEADESFFFHWVFQRIGNLYGILSSDDFCRFAFFRIRTPCFYLRVGQDWMF